MIMLLVLFLTLLWLAIVFGATIVVTLILPKKWWRGVIRIVLMLVLIPVPWVDEYFGKKQFEELCKENAHIQIAPNAAGRTVYLQQPQRVTVPGTWVPVVLTPWRFIDANTREAVVSYNSLQASGGRFTRGLSGGGVPLTFKGYCEPSGTVDPVSLLKEHQITQVQRSELGAGEKGTESTSRKMR